MSTVKLKDIRRNGGTQMRQRLSEVAVVTYADHMQDGVTFPPVVVFHDGTDYWLADGFHRCAAYAEAKIEDVPADVRSGTRLDAIKYAIGANDANGKPREAADMAIAYKAGVDNGLCDKADTQAVKALLKCSSRWASHLTKPARDKEKANRDAEIERLANEGKSQREIAKAVGVDAATVNRVAKKNPSETQHPTPKKAEVDPLAEAQKRDEEVRRLTFEQEKQNRYAKAARKVKEHPESVQSRQNETQHAEINAKEGDVYLIKGKQGHKLIVGDAFDVDDIKSKAGPIDCVITDPPYGINYKSPTGSAMAVRGDYKVIEADNQDFNPSILFEYSEKVVTWGGNHYANCLPNSPGWLVWDKRDGEQINNNSDCEMAWTNMLGSARLFHHRWNGMIKASEHGTRRIHPTQKPIKLFVWCLEVVDAGKNVLDMFAGSGSTLLACDETERSATLVEKDAVYASAIIKRLQENGFEVIKK